MQYSEINTTHAGSSDYELNMNSEMSMSETKYVSQFLRKGMKILLLNCISGEAIAHMLGLGLEVVGHSADTETQIKLQKMYPNVSIVETPCFNLTFEDDYFDAVLFLNKGLDAVYPESKRILTYAEIWKVLKRYGLFIYSSHNRDAKINSLNSLINILINLATFQFLNDYWFQFYKNKIKLVWYGQVENELLTLQDLGFNMAEMTDLDRKKILNTYIACKR